MKLVLLGYMASGKSTIGKLLSEKLFVPFIDLDEYIEFKENSSITTIFKEKGEIYFRNIEHRYLKELIHTEEHFVLSLGGGTPCYANNMELILKSDHITAMYLQASIPTIVERLIAGKDKRPLVKELGDEKLTEYVAKHLFERRFFYEQAHHKVVIDHKKIDAIITEIRMLLH